MSFLSVLQRTLRIENAVPITLGVGAVAGYPAQGRLTLETGVPVSTTDQSAKTALFYTPYIGNLIAVFDGTIWQLRTFAELTLSLVGLTASKPHDIFIVDTAGVLTLEAVVWATATARATAIVQQDGVYVKSGATTRRYLGSVYINASGGQTDDTLAKRYLWNMYNRRPRALTRLETATSWTYTTAAFRQANNSPANQVEIMNGLPEQEIALTATGIASNSAAGASSTSLITAIGEDVTNAAVPGSTTGLISASGVNFQQDMVATVNKAPAVGYHFYPWLEFSTAVPTTTWYGAGSNVTGLSGVWWT